MLHRRATRPRGQWTEATQRRAEWKNERGVSRGVIDRNQRERTWNFFSAESARVSRHCTTMGGAPVLPGIPGIEVERFDLEPLFLCRAGACRRAAASSRQAN